MPAGVAQKKNKNYNSSGLEQEVGLGSAVTTPFFFSSPDLQDQPCPCWGPHTGPEAEPLTCPGPGKTARLPASLPPFPGLLGLGLGARLSHGGGGGGKRESTLAIASFSCLG